HAVLVRGGGAPPDRGAGAHRAPEGRAMRPPLSAGSKALGRGTPRGFTLVEILMVSVILALVTGAVFESVRRTRLLIRRVEAHHDMAARARRVMERLGGDLENALPDPASFHALSETAL